MSNDPSPWAEWSEPFPEPERASTAELLREAVQDRREEEAESQKNALLYEKYANRMTRDGRIIL
jgi:hypothetical protein